MGCHALRACSPQAQPRPVHLASSDHRSHQLLDHDQVGVGALAYGPRETGCQTSEDRGQEHLRILRRAYRRGLLLERGFDHLFERLMRAEAYNDGT